MAVWKLILEPVIRNGVLSFQGFDVLNKMAVPCNIRYVIRGNRCTLVEIIINTDAVRSDGKKAAEILSGNGITSIDELAKRLGAKKYEVISGSGKLTYQQ